MSLEKAITFARSFMRFCEENKIEPVDAGKMVRLRQRIANYAFASCNHELSRRSNTRQDNMMRDLDTLAAKYNMTVDFGNPYPALRSAERYIEIPCVE